MSNQYIVFSQVPDGVPLDEFNAWYDEHLPEILSIPGFVSAQRYEMTPAVRDERGHVNYGFAALFELDSDPADAMREMAERNLSTVDSYVDFKDDPDDAGPALPSWWGQVKFVSWTAVPVGEVVHAEG